MSERWYLRANDFSDRAVRTVRWIQVKLCYTDRKAPRKVFCIFFHLRILVAVFLFVRFLMCSIHWSRQHKPEKNAGAQVNRRLQNAFTDSSPLLVLFGWQSTRLAANKVFFNRKRSCNQNIWTLFFQVQDVDAVTWDIFLDHRSETKKVVAVYLEANTVDTYVLKRLFAIKSQNFPPILGVLVSH